MINHPNRQSIRLKNYDYSQPGTIFITICTHNREPLFGEIKDQILIPNQFGKIVSAVWEEIPDHFPNVDIDAFVVMPNHVHGIVSFVQPTPNVGAESDDNTNIGGENPMVGARHASPLQKNASPVPTTLSQPKNASPLPIQPHPNQWRNTQTDPNQGHWVSWWGRLNRR